MMGQSGVVNFEVVFFRDIIFLQNGAKFVILILKISDGYNRFVVRVDQIIEARMFQSKGCAF